MCFTERLRNSSGVARHFDWGDRWSKTRTPRFAHELKEIFTKWRHFTTVAHVSPWVSPLF